MIVGGVFFPLAYAYLFPHVQYTEFWGKKFKSV